MTWWDKISIKQLRALYVLIPLVWAVLTIRGFFYNLYLMPELSLPLWFIGFLLLFILSWLKQEKFPVFPLLFGVYFVASGISILAVFVITLWLH